MEETVLKKKLSAMLHDPPDKPLIFRREAHEKRAEELLKLIETSASITEEAKRADHIASAADRINFPRNLEVQVDFQRKPYMVHPLSGKEFRLPASAVSAIAGVDYQQVMSLVEENIKEISQRYQDLERKFLSLWAELLGLLKERGNEEASLGQWWEIIPADSRVPDHSIWEHMRVASAISGALPEPALLLFSIGPVQSFIATARKTQDLWAGSYMLSYLSWSAMKVVAEELGPDSIIFPDLLQQPFVEHWLKKEKNLQFLKEPDMEQISSPTLPNRFLAVVPAEMAKDIATRAKESVKETFRQMAETVKEKIEEKVREKINEFDQRIWDNIWQRQTEDFIETYWAAVRLKSPNEFINYYKRLTRTPRRDIEDLLEVYQQKGFPPNEGTVYEKNYRLLNKTLGSRKLLREFSQQEEPNYKCTLCGQREPLHPGMYNNMDCREKFKALRGFWQEVMLQEFADLRKGERLCAVCLTKRFVSGAYFREKLALNLYDNFPSVGIVATSAFKLRVIENMDKQDISALMGLYLDAIEKLVGDRWKGIPMPMVKRACRDEISRRFAQLEGEWIYEESLSDSEFKSLWEENRARFNGDEKTFKELFRDTQQKLRNLHNAFRRYPQIGMPSKYYAVLLMDGDNMGRWLSGEMAPKIAEVLHPEIRHGLEEDPSWNQLLNLKRPLSPSLHLSISKALRNFSLIVVREIVERDHLGKLVYSGGDDVLAFLSLSHLPEVIMKLRAYFSGALKISDAKEKVEIDFKDGSGFVPVDSEGRPINVDSRKEVKGFLAAMGTTATASMGVVIAHYSENLSQVLRAVREAEKEAKSREGKDSLCITLIKRAGGEVRFRGRYFYERDGRLWESLPLLRDWINAFQNGLVSPRFAYDLRRESLGLDGLDERPVKLELFRIAQRHKNKKAEDFSEEHLQQMIEGLMVLYSEEGSLEQVAEFLSIAAFLGREENR